VYADESFLDSLNDYHLAAARAHRDHSMDALNMPAPVPPTAPATPVSPWAGVIVADDPPGLNGHNPEGA
jgi:hypothetical protein